MGLNYGFASEFCYGGSGLGPCYMGLLGLSVVSGQVMVMAAGMGRP